MPVVTPLIVLSSPYSSAALVASMLGRHPSAYAVPELNLFAEPCLSDLLDRLPANRMHGLLRAVAQIYGGEQTLESIEMARRWIFRRARQETPIVYRELCQRVTPRRLIEVSPLYTEGGHEKILRRIRDAFPEADYLHLVRHPFAQCLSWLKDPSALPELQRLESFDPSSDRLLLDPQFDWYRRHSAIVAFLREVASERQRCVLSEDVLADAQGELARLCSWLGFEWNQENVDAMLHPEHSPFSGPGPYGTEGGTDPAFLASAHYQRQPREDQPLDQALPWRPDGGQFVPKLIELARSFGYP